MDVSFAHISVRFVRMPETTRTVTVSRPGKTGAEDLETQTRGGHALRFSRLFKLQSVEFGNMLKPCSIVWQYERISCHKLLQPLSNLRRQRLIVTSSAAVFPKYRIGCVLGEFAVLLSPSRLLQQTGSRRTSSRVLEFRGWGEKLSRLSSR